jgi:sugar lactone lactonase YvrE
MSTWTRRISLTLGAVVVLATVGGAALYAKHGTGDFYPDTSTPAVYPEAALERVITLDFPPGNVATSRTGRVFFNYHPFAQAHRFAPAAMFELREGKAQPYPSAEHQSRFQGVFGMTVDRQNRLWLIEPRGLDHERTRLTAFDLNTNQPVFEHTFAADEAQFTQDLRVSADGKTVYLADTGLFRFTPASLLGLDVASKTHRRVLEQDASAQPQNWITQRFDGKPHKLAWGLVAFTVGLDGIEVSADGQWLYYATMSHDTAYRVPTAALNDPTLSVAQLSAKIEKVGKKPLSDGITLDPQGNLLITDIEHSAIAKLSADGKLQTLARRNDIIWSDGITMAADGSGWLTDSGIPAYLHPLALPPSLDALSAKRPYGIYRLPKP